MVALFFWLRGTAWPRARDVTKMIPWLAVLGVVGFILQSRERRERFRRMWKANPELQQDHIFTMEEEGIRVSNPFGETLFRWSDFNHWAETRNLFLLVRTTGVRLMVPKRGTVNDAKLRQIRELLRVHLHEHGGGFPVIVPDPTTRHTSNAG